MTFEQALEECGLTPSTILVNQNGVELKPNRTHSYGSNVDDSWQLVFELAESGEHYARASIGEVIGMLQRGELSVFAYSASEETPRAESRRMRHKRAARARAADAAKARADSTSQVFSLISELAAKLDHAAELAKESRYPMFCSWCPAPAAGQPQRIIGWCARPNSHGICQDCAGKLLQNRQEANSR